MNRLYRKCLSESVKWMLVALLLVSTSPMRAAFPAENGVSSCFPRCSRAAMGFRCLQARRGFPCIARRHFPIPACTGVAQDQQDKATASIAAPEHDWTSLFDGRSLDGWEITNFGGEGQVRVEEGSILMDFGEMLTGIAYQREFPKSDYEIRLEAMRTDGIDFFCGLTFPVADSHCSFIAAGWAGAVVGLSCIDGKDASENETTKYMNFENNRWYRFRVRVTGERIQAWIDDRQVVDQVIRGRKISIRPEVDLSKPLGIAAWQSRAALRGLQYRRLDR